MAIVLPKNEKNKLGKSSPTGLLVISFQLLLKPLIKLACQVKNYIHVRSHSDLDCMLFYISEITNLFLRLIQ